MNVHIEALDAVQKKLTFEIPPDRVKEEVEKTYRTFQRTAQVKGFRAGKVPRPVLERHFGEQVASEVSAHLIEESYIQALQEHSLQVVADPHIVPEKLISGQPFRYSATVELRPEIVVKDHEGVEAEKTVRKVTEEEVDKSLAQIAESLAQLHPITDRDQVENDDVATIDYAASSDGRPLSDLQGKGRLVEIGKEVIFPGFQGKLIGARKGETVHFSLPFPREAEDPQEPAPTERLAAFRVTVQDLARKEVPTLDDEFAKDHGECDTLVELREKVRTNLQQHADRQANDQLQDAVMTRLLELNPFEVPPTLVREQMRRMLIDARMVSPDIDAVTLEARLPEGLRDGFMNSAKKQVQVSFLLEALATQLELSVPDEEVQQQVSSIAERVGPTQLPQITAFYGREENRRALRNRLLHEKALHLVVEKARVKVVEREVAGPEEKE
ncbi:MAG: trigger factor [Deltaproteobacteria bacterium]|nr:trigger factor [Deltaproteobacteria bacterium]